MSVLERIQEIAGDDYRVIPIDEGKNSFYIVGNPPVIEDSKELMVGVSINGLELAEAHFDAVRMYTDAAIKQFNEAKAVALKE